MLRQNLILFFNVPVIFNGKLSFHPFDLVVAIMQIIEDIPSRNVIKLRRVFFNWVGVHLFDILLRINIQISTDTNVQTFIVLRPFGRDLKLR